MAEEKLVRIGELAKITGASPQTIHFYLREGLLPRPIKTAPNMAYYGPEHVEDIRLIKRFQERQYLPLSLIKHILDEKRKGKGVHHIEDMRFNIEKMFRPLGPEEELEPVTVVEFVAMTGLPATTAEELEAQGLLAPTDAPQGKRYDGLDVRIARALKKLLDLGLEPADLDIYRRFTEALKAEATAMLEKVMHRPGAPGITGTELKDLLDDLKTALTARVQRRVVMDHFGEEVGERGPG